MGKGELWHPADQKPLNRSSQTLTHVITSWVPTTKQNLDTFRPGVSSPHIREIYALRVRMFTTLFLFFLVLPHHWPWMPLNRRNAPLAEIKSSYGAHQKKLNEDRSISLVAKCRPMILVARNIRYMRICAGCSIGKCKQPRMRGKAQRDGRPDLQIIKTPFLYFSPLLDQSTRATPLFG